jgi:hypothetical protein
MRTIDLSRRPFVSVLAVALLAATAGCGGAVPAPTAYATWLDKGGKFVCDYPKGWEADGGGKPDSPNSWAKFTAGAAEIKVDSDIAGSLLGDMAGAGRGGFGQNEEPPVARIHPMGIRSMKENYAKYEEREPKPFQTKGLGEGRRSTFTAEQTLGGKVYGYRATLLGGDRRITVVCSCPATNWQTLKPAFEKVVNSLRTSP